ncbi:MAG: undecaprenyl-diphosphate phosphatase [Candidatus Pacebacteria bacterium]|nr:undecaprenyl-diphosphate phosphatase [Candidatus Paceibacterota bacterium]
MEIIQSIILGIIQGVAEFLPISSSGHLVLVPHIFGWHDQGLAFDVALHWGTLIAVIVYFRKDWIDIISKSYLFGKLTNYKFKITDSKQITNSQPKAGPSWAEKLKSDILFIIIIATIPGVVAGLLLNTYAETVFRDPLIVAGALFVGAILLFYTDKTGAKKSDLQNLTLKMGIIIGLFQALAIVPGVSRSGITITIALFLGIQRTAAARFSFLLSTPIILGAGIKELPSLVESGLNINILIGVLVSAASGYLAIKYMLKYLENKNYNIFVGYRILLSIAILFFVLF